MLFPAIFLSLISHDTVASAMLYMLLFLFFVQKYIVKVPWQNDACVF